MGTHKHAPSPVVSIPEILERIFANLEQFTLRHNVRLVCRTWKSICEPIVNVKSTMMYRLRKSGDILHVLIPETVQSGDDSSAKTSVARLFRSNCLDLRMFDTVYHANPAPLHYLRLNHKFASVDWD
ncbi:hypothetical protein BGZ94_009415 [Podila epigama]|nr:hypothetical protein BGZ94_009415 [Podila epigama]